MRVPVLSLCVLALTACSSGSGGDAPVTRAELPNTVLQPADVGRGWNQFVEGKQVRSDAHPGPRSDPSRFDRVGGWIARYRRTTARPAGPTVLESRADLFRDEGGAKDDLGAYREELRTGIPGSGGTPTELAAPAVGDAAVAGQLRQGPLVLLTVAWRRANASASVTALGPAATTKLDGVVSLARRQDRRLERAASG